jgi:transposase
VREAQIFIGALGASNYFYIEATWTQTLPDWIAAHVRMLEDFGGTTALIVPDNLRAGVTHASFYEPELNPTYQDFATHYGTAILPTRVARPRDKAKVESAGQVAERLILAPLRNHRFTSLAELNAELTHLRHVINDRPFQKRAGTRRQLFETLDRPALRPLPPTRYELAEWRTAKVNIDYHISVDGHLYSVPYALVRATVRVRLTTTMVEVLHQGTRVAAHVRSVVKGRFTTEPAHRPKSHQAHLEWTPSRLMRWGRETGPATGQVIEHILKSKPHPEQGYRACLGLLSLRRRYASARGRVRPCVYHRGDQLSLREIDPRRGARSAPTRGPHAAAPAAGDARECPRVGLLRGAGPTDRAHRRACARSRSRPARPVHRTRLM